jgi:hypothetical protein
VSELLGWLATAVFAGSYFVRGRQRMLAIQMAGALLWVGYGLLVGAAPVIVANGIVLSAAVYSLARPRAEEVKTDGGH